MMGGKWDTSWKLCKDRETIKNKGKAIMIAKRINTK